MSVVRWILFSLFALVLIACGGSSDSMVAPKAVIAWPSQTREINAPAYAASAVITLTPDSSRTPVTWTADRPAGTGAQTLTYPGPQVPKNTTGTLSVMFKSLAAGGGTTVATASVDVKVGEDGTILNPTGGALGTVGYLTSLTGIIVDVPDVNLYNSENALVIGRSSTGIVALPQDLVTLSITNGGNHVTLSNGIVTGTSVGAATIQATYELFTATDTFNVIVPDIPSVRYQFGAKQIAADMVHNKVWGTFASNSAYPNSIVDIDTQTGSVGTPIAVGGEPDAIAISADGSVAYVGLNSDQAIRVVDLGTRTVGVKLNYTQLIANSYPSVISINPTNNSEIAIGVKSAQNGAPSGPYILRTDGTSLAPTTINNIFQDISWLNGTEVIRAQNNGAIAKYGITATSVDLLQNYPTGVSITGNIHTKNSAVLTDNGRVFSSSDFSVLANLGVSDFILGVAVDSTNNLAWAPVGYTSDPLRIKTFELSNYSGTSAYQLQMHGEPYLQIIRFGTTGIAIRSTNSVYVIPTAPGL